MAFTAITSGATDLYETFNDTDNLANVILQNQVGMNSNGNLTMCKWNFFSPPIKHKHLFQ